MASSPEAQILADVGVHWAKDLKGAPKAIRRHPKPNFKTKAIRPGFSETKPVTKGKKTLLVCLINRFMKNSFNQVVDCKRDRLATPKMVCFYCSFNQRQESIADFHNLRR